MFEVDYTEIEAMSLSDRMDMIDQWNEEMADQLAELRQVSAALRGRMVAINEKRDEAL
jgi:phage shock protein A